MKTTARRITLSLTKEDLRCLDELMKRFEETPSDIIKRAIAIMYFYYDEPKECNENFLTEFKD